MIIEIRGVGFVNKGAELMLMAALKKLREHYPDALYTLAPHPTNGPDQIQRIVGLGLYPKAWLHYRGIQWGYAASFIPRKLRQLYGLVVDREVDVVIDASGFAYSDQWGLARTRELEKAAKRWRAQDTRVILLPQAFGPFEKPRIGDAIRAAADHIDLMLAREQTSYDALTRAAGVRESIRCFPDFTNLIDGTLPESFDPDTHQICLVPNYRMIDKTGGDHGQAYEPFMVHCASHLKDRDAKPFLLVHEGPQDRGLAERVSRACGGLPILEEQNPLNIKGILGNCRATIGSRYHGLVSALGQGVPSLGTGWSHKYAELFADYGIAEGLVAVDDSPSTISEQLDQLIDGEYQKHTREQLLEASRNLKSQSEKMWQEVLAVVGQSRHQPRNQQERST